MFSIDVLERQAPVGRGRITIGDFAEEFEMDLSFWAAEQYETSWRDAFLQLASATGAVSCLVTSMADPADANFVFCWPLYRDGDTVRVRNNVLFLDELDEPFDPERPWASVPADFEAADEDGNRISEWTTDMSQVYEFMRAG
jgi:hypothetical protein